MLTTVFSILMCVSPIQELSNLEKAVASGDPKLVEQVIQAMAKGASAIDMDQVIKHALLADNPAIENAALRGLAKLTPGPGLTWLCTQAKQHPQKQVRDLLIRYLGSRKDVESFRAVLQGLYDQEDSVALGAIKTLLEKEHRGAIPHLIRALQYQEDRDRDLCLVAEQLRNILGELTGADLFAASEWDTLWKSNRKELEQNKKLDPAKIVLKGTGVKIEPVNFFGQELVSQKIVFVLDTSISMQEKDPKPESSDDHQKGGKGEGTSVGGNARKRRGGSSDELPDSRMRLRRVQKELKRMVRELPKDFHFCLISFDEDVEKMSDFLIKALPDQKRRAIKFIERFDPEGFTSTDLALDAAFNIKGVRTIVLLSDGMPYRAKDPIDGTALLEHLDTINRFEHIPIHTIGFRATAGSASTFLQELSRRSGGKYTEIP